MGNTKLVNSHGESFEEWRFRIVEEARGTAPVSPSLRQQDRALAVWRHERRKWWAWRILVWALMGLSALLAGAGLCWVLGKL